MLSSGCSVQGAPSAAQVNAMCRLSDHMRGGFNAGRMPSWKGRLPLSVLARSILYGYHEIAYFLLHRKSVLVPEFDIASPAEMHDFIESIRRMGRRPPNKDVLDALKAADTGMLRDKLRAIPGLHDTVMQHLGSQPDRKACIVGFRRAVNVIGAAQSAWRYARSGAVDSLRRSIVKGG